MSKRRPTPPQPESTTSAVLTPSLTIQSDRQAGEPFFNVPTSPAVNLYMQVFSSSGNLPALATRKNKLSHGQRLTVAANHKNPDEVAIVYEAGNDKLTLVVDELTSLISGATPAAKLFLYSLIKLDEQGIHEGRVTNHNIGFSAQELVDYGFYKNVRTAVGGAERAFDVLVKQRVKGETKRGKKQEKQTDVAPLFKRLHAARYCEVVFNDEINWNVVIQFFTKIPRYSFGLPPKAFSLIFYLFFLARQQGTEKLTTYKEVDSHGKPIGEEKPMLTFTIGLRQIQARLGLPDETTSPNPYRDTLGQIDEAIRQIEEAAETTHFSIVPVYDERASVKEKLDHGYLAVTLKDEYAAPFADLIKSKTQQIEKAQKRQERIEDTARAKALEKHIEAAQKAE